MSDPLPKVMSALRYRGPGDIAIEQMNLPCLDPGDLLVEIAACGLCATDVKTFVRGHPKIRPGAVLGHEMVGVVVNGGGNWRPGDRVAVAPYCPCGVCRHCRRGQPTLCGQLFSRVIEPGGLAEFIRVPAALIDDLVVRVPDHLSSAQASLAEPFACCLHVLESCAVGPGDSVLVIGDGPMGLMQAAAARALGASSVIVAGMTPHRMEYAARTADRVIDVNVEPLESTVKGMFRDGLDVVIVSVASTEAVSAALLLASRGGIVDLFAGTAQGSMISVPANLIHYDGVRLQGTFGFSPAHFRSSLEWIATGRINFDALITGLVPMAGVADALGDASQQLGIKTVMLRDPHSV